MTNFSTHKNAQSGRWIWLTLVLTLTLVIWTALQEDSVTIDAVERINTNAPAQNKFAILPVDKNPAPIVIKQNAQLIDWEKLNRVNKPIEKSPVLFNQHSWVVMPPAPKVTKLPPPPPTAPPVPFAYMGRLDHSPKGNLIYLATLDQSYSVVVGNKVDSFWKLEKEDAQHLYFTYLPLNLPQVLDKNQRLSAQEISSENSPAATSDIVNAFSQ